MKKIGRYDAIVVGSGLAGLTTALHLAPLKVLLISKGEDSNSRLAQGGIAAAIGTTDSPAQHLQDTLVASSFSADSLLAEILTSKAQDAIDFLTAHGVIFDKDPDGQLVFNIEAAHSNARVLRAGGDSIGEVIMSALSYAVSKSSHIESMSGTLVKDLLIDRACIGGVVAVDRYDQWIAVESGRVILASGGAGQLFSRTTNPVYATADGIAMAKRAGVSTHQLEMIQFHPTALATSGAQIPLISEALRGAGARLVDIDGNYIMKNTHPMQDLAPRDIVARAISDCGKDVYLDAREVTECFPTITQICKKEGIDPAKDLIPVSPAAHYFMGGVACDDEGKTELPGLWVVGECAGSGLHGANRLASNSLLECIVYGKRVATSCHHYPERFFSTSAQDPLVYDLELGEIEQIRKTVQTKMFKALGPVRSLKEIENVFLEISSLSFSISKTSYCRNIKAAVELENIIECSKAICLSALANRNSIGAHYLKTGISYDSL